MLYGGLEAESWRRRRGQDSSGQALGGWGLGAAGERNRIVSYYKLAVALCHAIRPLPPATAAGEQSAAAWSGRKISNGGPGDEKADK